MQFLKRSNYLEAEKNCFLKGLDLFYLMKENQITVMKVKSMIEVTFFKPNDIRDKYTDGHSAVLLRFEQHKFAMDYLKQTL